MKTTLVTLCLVGLLAVTCTGCNQSAADISPAKTITTYPYKVVSTCGMVSDIVRNVAGDKAQVTGLMGEGVDPHLYKPTRNDVAQLISANVVFYSGLMLEGRMADTFARVARKGKVVYPVTEEIDESYLLEPPEFAGHWDPHVWMDVDAWSQCVAFVAKALGEFDSANAEYYESNASAYRDELQKLHRYARESIATVEAQQRVLVTAHDAFGYFGRAYEISVRSAQGLSTESEAGIEDINNLVQFIVDNKIPAIFIESSVSKKNIQAIVEGSQSKGWNVRIGGELFSDAMGARGTYEGTYIGMIDHNVTVITRALGGNAPAGGLQGKLNK